MLHSRNMTHYYSPQHSVFSTSSARTRGEEHKLTMPPTTAAPATAVSSVILLPIVGASGGLGASTCALQLARLCAHEGLRTCVIDVDFSGGGLDVLAGCEEQEGLRWHNIQAPLGSIDAEGFLNELIQWDGIPLLPYSPWENRDTQWWEIKAVFEAASVHSDIIICDCGRTVPNKVIAAWKSTRAQLTIIPVILMQCTTLGIARCSVLLECMRHNMHPHFSDCESALLFESACSINKLVSKTRKRNSHMSVAQVEDFLHARIYGSLPSDPRITRSDAQGWPLPQAKPEYERVLQAFIREYCLTNSPDKSGTTHRNTRGRRVA